MKVTTIKKKMKVFKKISILSFTVLFTFACTSNQQKEKKTNFSDSIEIIENNLDSAISFNTKYFSPSNYPINYIGEPKRVIFINHNLKICQPPLREGQLSDRQDTNARYEYYLDCTQKMVYKSFLNSKIEIVVNTDRKIKNINTRLKENVFFYAYPVFLKNLQSDTLIIGFDEHLPIIMEALDNKGKWNPIEGEIYYGCENGRGRVILPPNQIVITSVRINSGNFETKLRLKYGKNYSNEFLGKINLTQFNRNKDNLQWKNY